MHDAQLITLALAIIGALLTLVAALIGWIGVRVINKLDTMEKALHDRITDIDKRVVRVETKCDFNHTADA